MWKNSNKFVVSLNPGTFNILLYIKSSCHTMLKLRSPANKTAKHIDVSSKVHSITSCSVIIWTKTPIISITQINSITYYCLILSTSSDAFFRHILRTCFSLITSRRAFPTVVTLHRDPIITKIALFNNCVKPARLLHFEITDRVDSALSFHLLLVRAAVCHDNDLIYHAAQNEELFSNYDFPSASVADYHQDRRRHCKPTNCR